MSYLPDTNILLRTMQPTHSLYEEAVRAVETLLMQGETLYLIPQTIRELWNVATRPIANNGLGLSPQQASTEINRLETTLTFVADSPIVYIEWRRLVETYNVLGVQVHDTNLVAAMLAHGIMHLLTFNGTHFQRFAEIAVVHPRDVAIVPRD